MYGRGKSDGRSQNGSKNYSARSTAGGGGGGSSTLMAPVKNYQTVPSDSGLIGSSGGAMLEGEWSSLNPSLYQNMSNEQVDWAALAQQWIQMKETLPADMVPAAPPPPIISESYGSNSRDSLPDGNLTRSVEEQGEAPMEVERDEDHTSMAQHSANPWDNGSVSWQYPAQSQWRNQAWDQNWSSGASDANKNYDASSFAASTINPNASLAVANWQAKMARIYKLGDASEGSNAIAGTVQPIGQSSSQHDSSAPPKRIPGLMDQVIKFDHHSDGVGDQGDPEDDPTQTLNDAKRKLLPAWIREGLEKMEREKQRQAEKEREQQQRAEMLQQRRQAELEALNELEAAKRKSKFESDSDDDDTGNDDQPEAERRGEDSPVPTRSREEILQELMIAVRKNLTEILLEVTNEEIALVAKETLNKTRRKAPTAQALRKTGLATLTGGLGLGIYGDSDEEDDSASDNDRDDDGNSEDDEEAERALKSSIKLRQKEFEWTAREIEEEIAKEEAAEERKKREYEQMMRQQSQQNNASDEEDYAGSSNRAGLGHPQAAVAGTSGGKFGPRDGETQPVNDKLYAYKLGRTRDKRISRFSDPKDTVRQTHITHVAIVNHKPGEVVPPLAVSKASQVPPSAVNSTVVSPPVVDPTSTPLFPAAIAAARHLEDIRRGSSVVSETPSNASSSRASSSRRETETRKASHKSHKSKKRKRSRRSRSDDDDDDYYDNDDDRYSQHSRRSRSSEKSSYSRRRRSYSRDSRDDDRDRKYSYKSRDRSRSRSRDRYKSSRRRSRSRSRSPSRRRY
ncbi:arginine/serine-rich protein PNISR-like [Armigeres subalbatus]|uniref:arginine/serine-rich protein PNISR-like n=1 Tax=Armigeres subalbatus TaxID=124917 RepID=UPI002ED54B42